MTIFNTKTHCKHLFFEKSYIDRAMVFAGVRVIVTCTGRLDDESPSVVCVINLIFHRFHSVVFLTFLVQYIFSPPVLQVILIIDDFFRNIRCKGCITNIIQMTTIRQLIITTYIYVYICV